MAAMDDAVTALADQQAELTGILDGLDEAGWQRPSRCEGWTVGDVVLHLAQTNEMAIASVEDRIPQYLEAVGRSLADAPEADLQAREHPLWPLYYAGHDVITALRIATEGDASG